MVISREVGSSIWFTTMKCLNLPPWVVGKQDFMPAGVIFPQGFSVKDLGVIFPPFSSQFDKKVHVYDALDKTSYDAHLSMLWDVQDDPGLAKMKNCSTGGRFACPQHCKCLGSAVMSGGKYMPGTFVYTDMPRNGRDYWTHDEVEKEIEKFGLGVPAWGGVRGPEPHRQFGDNTRSGRYSTSRYCAGMHGLGGIMKRIYSIMLQRDTMSRGRVMQVEKAAGRTWGILDDTNRADETHHGGDDEAYSGDEDGDGDEEELEEVGGNEEAENDDEAEEADKQDAADSDNEGQVEEQSDDVDGASDEVDDESEQGTSGMEEDGCEVGNANAMGRDIEGPSLSRADKRKLRERGTQLPWELSKANQRVFNQRFKGLLLPFGKQLRNPIAHKKLKSAHWVLLCSDVSKYLLDGLIEQDQLLSLANFIDALEALVLNYQVTKDCITSQTNDLMHAASELQRYWPLVINSRVMHAVVCHVGDSIRMLGPGPLFSMWSSESGFGKIIRSLGGRKNLEQEVQNNEVVKTMSLLYSVSSTQCRPPSKFRDAHILVRPSSWKSISSSTLDARIILDAMSQMLPVMEIWIVPAVVHVKLVCTTRRRNPT